MSISWAMDGGHVESPHDEYDCPQKNSRLWYLLHDGPAVETLCSGKEVGHKRWHPV